MPRCSCFLGTGQHLTHHKAAAVRNCVRVHQYNLVNFYKLFWTLLYFHGAQDASVLLDAWQRLLLDPSTTLPAGSSLRGQLLTLVSGLIEDVAAGKPTAAGRDGTAVLVAALRLLDLNPDISRWVPQM